MNTLSIFHEEGIALIKLNRPSVRNAMDDRMIAELGDLAHSLHEDPSVRIVILSGEGDAFCSGMDLAYLKRLADFDESENRADGEALLRLLLGIRRSPLVWIAAVNGPAIAGGCGLASACDLVYADREKARFGYPEVRIGFVPALVSSLLVDRVGETRARDLLLSGRILKAERALDFGLVNELAEPGQVLSHAGTRASRLSSEASRASLASTKSLLHRIRGLDLESAMELCLDENVRLRMSPSCKKGVGAFLDKQELDWRKLD